MLQSLEQLGVFAMGALTVFYLFVRYSQSYWKRRGILHEKPHFLWGNLKGVGRSRHVAMAIRKLYAKYQDRAPFIGFYAWLKPMVVALDLNLIRCILAKDEAHFKDRGLYCNVEDDSLASSVWQMDGKGQERLKTMLHTIFDGEAIDSIYPAMQQVAAEFERSLRHRLSSESVVDIADVVESYCLDTIALQAFGTRCSSLETRKTHFHTFVQNHFEKFDRLRALIMWNFPELAMLLNLRVYHEATMEFVSSTVNAKLKDRDFQNESRDTILKKLADLKRIHVVDSKVITAQVFSFVSHGLELLSSTLTFCLYELAIHKDIQDKARDEIKKLLATSSSELHVRQLESLEYLKQILCETLRKYTPYPVLFRKVNEDYEIPDSVFMLRQGNSIIIPIDAIHHDERYFPEPERFDPTRYDAETAQRRSEFCWLPFGTGSRACSAQYFSRLHMLLLLVILLPQYKISPHTDTPIPLEFDNSKIVLSPKGKVRLRLEPLV